ncbi:toprim domain-containing protein [Pseudomonas aeruginosa]|uniref:toprim domain-containing protein n=1 Tax=Pseudomonas aeruginosa TaxID=287 RepID=UPI00071C113A|nr:toprim domain-containing protein [Pseudomonas aeruginosa]EKW5310712.1 toprim domain-containing protein [Pseudomonas aeruginosa]KSP23807.1 hypothetical protein APB14_30665 [Pseudomonas aeruginosa]MDU0699528.1 toprim domain-containing protein [Pseudomonas aeruginosa]OTI72651.1 hypothetical protein CAZ09_32725 [Pseudomonas aeruginosa]HBP0164635.1 hypothetical protein [Pseudomonas aeruginosa]
MKTSERMVGRWADALRSYGLTEKQLGGKHTECPICGGKDRFRFDDKEGSGSYYCNGCGAGDGFKLAMAVTGMSFKELAQDLDNKAGSLREAVRQERDYRGLLKRIHEGNVPLADIDPVVLYLRSRGIQAIPRSFLRFNQNVWNWSDKVSSPAMVAAMFDVEGKRKGYHLTFITKEGRKASLNSQKLYTPGQTGDCVIRLCEPSIHLGLAEGIETALSATQLYGVPCWATGDAGRMDRFKLPVGVEQVTIFADVDHSHTGEAAAESLARRLILQHKIPVEVRRDCPRGQDYNDLLMQRIREAS